MEELQIMQELETKLTYMIQNDNMTEGEIISIVNSNLERLINLLQECRVYIPTIEDYITGEIGITKQRVGYMCQDRRDNITDQVVAIIRGVQKQIENGENDQDSRDDNEVDRFDGIDTEDNVKTSQIIGIIEDYLMDVRSKIATIMDSNGFSQDKIEETLYRISEFKNSIILYDEENVHTILLAERERIIGMIKTEYEKAMDMVKKEDEKQDDSRQEFKEELDAGISLEEQAEMAKKRNDVIPNDEIANIIAQLGIYEDDDELGK